MKTLLFISGTLLLGIFCSLDKNKNKEENENNGPFKEAVGIWYAKNAKHPTKPQVIGDHAFKYDGKHLIMWLFCEKAWMWRTKDDYYKLKVKWEDNKLFYLPPFGRWSEFVEFDGERFLRKPPSDWETVPQYNRINEEDLPEFYAPLLKKGRSLHDYTVKPLDVPAWRKNSKD